MSRNIYEEPRFSLTERPQADGGEREERPVEIYESADAVDGCRDSAVTRKGGAHVEERPPAVQRSPFRGDVLALGLLCALLLLALAALSVLHVLLTQQKNFQELQSTHNDRTNASCQGNTGWITFRFSYYYKSGELKNWTEGRRDCQNRGADLVIINNREEQEFVHKLNGDEASWIGLSKEQASATEWRWVDGSEFEYQAWKTNVSQRGPSGGNIRAYMNEKGSWEQANTESKHWICEKAPKGE